MNVVEKVCCFKCKATLIVSDGYNIISESFFNNQLFFLLVESPIVLGQIQTGVSPMTHVSHMLSSHNISHETKT